MAVIKNFDNHSTIQVRKDVHFIFGSLETPEEDRLEQSIKAFNHFFDAFGGERPIFIVDWFNINKTGQWALTHDFRILEVLRYTPAPNPGFNKGIIRTAVATFAQNEDTFFGSDFDMYPDRYRISNKNKSMVQTIRERKNLTEREKLFSIHLAHGRSISDSYMAAFKTKNKTYAHDMGKFLVNQERVSSKVSDEVNAILTEQGVSKEYIVIKYKQLIDDGILDLKNCAPSVRAALKDLSDIAGLTPDKTRSNAQISRGEFGKIEDDRLAEIQEAEIISETSNLKDYNEHFEKERGKYLPPAERAVDESMNEVNQFMNDMGKSLIDG